MPQPLNKYVLIDPEGTESKENASGILMPNMDFELLSKGIVMETWAEYENAQGILERSQVKPADNVLFLYKEKDKRLSTMVDKRELYLVAESDIIAIL